MTLRIGTRGSALALAQARDVSRRLAGAGRGSELVVVTTAGDRLTDRAFTDIGAYGVFAREIENLLAAGHIDVAVHSYKDLPSRGPTALEVAAVPERLDPADVLLVRRDRLARADGRLPLARGARVGTSAARRRALLLETRPDLDVGLLRGNVPTRVRALVDGRFDAIVLAAAGLARLEREDGDARLALPPDVITVRLDPAWFVPAPSQGAIALQVRNGDEDAAQAVRAIDDAGCRRTLLAERTALRLAEGGCTLPFGAWCTDDGEGSLTLHAALGRGDGTVARCSAYGADPASLAARVWDALGEVAVR